MSLRIRCCHVMHISCKFSSYIWISTKVSFFIFRCRVKVVPIQQLTYPYRMWPPKWWTWVSCSYGQYSSVHVHILHFATFASFCMWVFTNCLIKNRANELCNIIKFQSQFLISQVYLTLCYKIIDQYKLINLIEYNDMCILHNRDLGLKL